MTRARNSCYFFQTFLWASCILCGGDGSLFIISDNINFNIINANINVLILNGYSLLVLVE